MRNNDSRFWFPMSGRRANRIPERAIGRHETEIRFIWVEEDKVTYVSCYQSPMYGVQAKSKRPKSCRIAWISDRIYSHSGRRQRKGYGMDHAWNWEIPHINTQGKLLLEMATRAEFVLNCGSIPNYSGPGFENSVSDVSFTTETTISQIQNFM